MKLIAELMFLEVNGIKQKRSLPKSDPVRVRVKGKIKGNVTGNATL